MDSLLLVGQRTIFEIVFVDNQPATVELTKRWVTYLTGLNLDKEIQETIDADNINNYQKR